MAAKKTAAKKASQTTNAHQIQLTHITEYEKATGVKMSSLRDAVLSVWSDIEETRIGGMSLLEVCNSGVISNLFHSLLPKKLESFGYRKDNARDEKDLHFAANPHFSLEIKTSTQPAISGSTSYTNVSDVATKERSSFYLCVFYTKDTGVSSIKFGVVNLEDWMTPKSKTTSATKLKASVLRDMVEIANS